MRSAHQNSNVCFWRQNKLTETYTRNDLYGQYYRQNTEEHFCFSWWINCPCNTSQLKAQFPSSWCCLDKLELSCAWLNPTCTPDLTKFSVFFISLFLYCSGGFLCVFLLLLASHPYHSPTACWAGTAIPCKERRKEKHSLIFLCTVTCTTFDHRQRLSHSWIGPKGRNNSRKTTLHC